MQARCCGTSRPRSVTWRISVLGWHLAGNLVSKRILTRHAHPHRINCIVVLFNMHLAAAVSPRVKLLTTHDDLLNCLFLRDLVWQGPVCFCTGPLPYHALPALALSYKVHFEPRRFEPPVERAPVPGAHRCAMPCYAMVLPARTLYSKLAVWSLA